MIISPKSPFLQRWFRSYNRNYLRRNFHGIHLDGDLASLQGDGKTPLLICLSHSSWWDLLLGLYLDDIGPDWDSYAPMDERQLRRYRFFSRLGVIGVDRTSLQGGRQFVDYCQTLLEGQPRALWITPQGAFTSNTARPVHFQPGLGCIAERLSVFYVTTVVFEYAFWSEKQPEIFISVRPLERVTVTPDFNRRRFVSAMERCLEDHLDSLAARLVLRDPSLFTALMVGKHSISPTYDTVRAVTSSLSGQPFTRAHGESSTPAWRDQKRGEP